VRDLLGEVFELSGDDGAFVGVEVVRERIYFGEPWESPAWRAQWVERMDPETDVR
jgi:hypothetical protein